MTEPSDETTAAWAGLVRAHRTTFGGVEAALKKAGFPPLSWYDVLLELDRRPEGLRLFELQRHLLLPQYNVSRLLNRMQREGLVSKVADSQDGRGRLLQITDAGRTLRRQMWPTYARAIQTHVGDRLTGSEAKRLANLTAKLSSDPTG